MPSTALSYAQAVRNLRLDSTWDQANAGSIKIYSGPVPASADAALAGNTLLASPTFGNPAFTPAAAGVKTANAIAQEPNAPATGTATFYRALKSDGVTVIGQGSVGATGSGESLTLNSTAIVAGNVVLVTSCVISEAP